MERNSRKVIGDGPQRHLWSHIETREVALDHLTKREVALDHLTSQLATYQEIPEFHEDEGFERLVNSLKTGF